MTSSRRSSSDYRPVRWSRFAWPHHRAPHATAMTAQMSALIGAGRLAFCTASSRKTAVRAANASRDFSMTQT